MIFATEGIVSIVLDNSKDDENNDNEAKNSENEEEKDEQGIIQEVHMKPEGAELSVSLNVISNNVSNGDATNVIQTAIDPASNVLMSKFMIVDQFGQQNSILLPAQSTFMVQNSAQGNLFLSPVGELQLNNAMHGNNRFMFQQQQIPAVPNIANHGVGNCSVANPGMLNVNPVSSEEVDNSGGVNPTVGNPVLGNHPPGDAHNTTPGDNPAIANTVPKQDIPNITPKASDVVDKSGLENVPVANDTNPVLGNGMLAVVPDNPVSVDPAVPDPAIANAIPNASDVFDNSGGGNLPVVNDANPVLGDGMPALVPDNPVAVNHAVPDPAITNAILNASDVLDKSGGGGNVPLVTLQTQY